MFNDGIGKSRGGNKRGSGDWSSAVVSPILADVTGQCSATASVPSTTDNCAGPVIGTTTDPLTYTTDRKSVVQGKSVDLGGRRIIKKKNVVIADTIPPVTPILADVTGQCSAT